MGALVCCFSNPCLCSYKPFWHHQELHLIRLQASAVPIRQEASEGRGPSAGAEIEYMIIWNREVLDEAVNQSPRLLTRIEDRFLPAFTVAHYFLLADLELKQIRG